MRVWLAASGVLPAEQLADAAYVCGSNLISRHARQIDLIAPTCKIASGKLGPKKASIQPPSGWTGKGRQ
jgi:hypothetical protein